MIGFFLSTNIFLVFVNNASVFFDKSSVKQYIVNSDLNYILLTQLFIFIGIGALSSFLSARRYMKN